MKYEHLKLPKTETSLQVYYLVKVNQRTVGHQIIQDFLNTSQIPYRSIVADSHTEALNELMTEEEFRANNND